MLSNEGEGVACINEVTLRRARLVLGWVTVFVGIPPRHTTSHLGQLSLIPSAGRETSTSKSAVLLCGWGVKARWLIIFVNKHVGLWVAGKAV